MEWPPHLQAALDGALAYADGHTQQTIEAAVGSELVQLWALDHSFCLTEKKVSPNGQVSVHLFLAGGDLTELQTLYPYIEGWARGEGAAKMTMLGRTGWERTFFVREEGFRPTLRFYEKELL